MVQSLINMKLHVDSDQISRKTDPEELRGLESVLKAFLQLVHKFQGRPDASEEPSSDQVKDDPESDPVGDVIILNHKQQQAKASLGRRNSGWMSTGYPAKVDDRHV
jgi:hypothetical protein